MFTSGRRHTSPRPATNSGTPHPRWSSLSVGERRTAALQAIQKTLTDRGFAVSAPRPGRSIVLDARRGNVAMEIHLRSSQGIGPAYWPKSILTPAANRYGCLVLLDDEHPPKIYLIPSIDWKRPDSLLVDRTYVGAASAPEWGINLPGGRGALQRYELDRVLRRF